MKQHKEVFDDPQKNLDYDDELLRLADREGAGEALRFWESPGYFVVLGRTSSGQVDVDLESCARDRIPVLRRSSGGGTVLQGPGCLNFSVVLAKNSHESLGTISGSYVYILGKVVRALKSLGIDAVFRPVCDLALAGTEQKFSGNAQRRGREYILHHGTILYGFELPLLSRYLKMPVSMPPYRQARPHGAFVTNIPARAEDIRRAIALVFEGRQL